jgi:hypothetical protein
LTWVLTVSLPMGWGVLACDSAMKWEQAYEHPEYFGQKG